MKDKKDVKEAEKEPKTAPSADTAKQETRQDTATQDTATQDTASQDTASQDTPKAEETPKNKVEEVNNNLRIALKKVREENKRLKEEVREPEPEPEVPEPQQDVEQRFLTTEQTAMQTAEELELLKLSQTDPFVKENLDLIETERKAGLTSAEAIQSVKAKVLDAMLVEGKSEPPVVPNTIKQEAEPEPTNDEPKDELMANAIKDVL